MALISCPECGHSVSESAASCPKCAHPINTSLSQAQPSQAAQRSPQSLSTQVRVIKEAVADPIVEQQRRSSSGGATGALLGAILGYFLMSSSCGMPETIEGFTMSLFFWSPVILLGMLLGYFLGKAVS